MPKKFHHSVNKLVIPAVLISTVIIAGIFAFMPVDNAITVDDQIIAAINGDPPVSNQDILVDLKDKLKLLNATDDDFIDFNPIAGATITVEALNAEGENVIFNLKEVYLCGDVSGDPGLENNITVNSIWIENVQVDGLGEPTDADIIIRDIYGGPLGVELIGGDTCVEVLSALANPGIGMVAEIIEVYPGRAGAMGLGSDNNLVILLDGSIFSQVDFVKCIAFTPNEAVELVCDLDEVFFLI